MFDGLHDYLSWISPSRRIAIYLAIGKNLVDGRISRAVIVWIARTKAYVLGSAQVHEPASSIVHEHTELLALWPHGL
ncbi:hypothetical protein ASF73_19575 [Xanthomonas sp. Leaf131]|nr:hypothetical protein ASF73_19575 [Xanthomonas sp. Leaf131]